MSAGSSAGKRGQGEILGLAVVVVLVIVGFMLALRFWLNEPKDDTTTVVIDRQLSSSMIATLLNTNLDCKDVTLSEVFQDCAQQGSTFEYCSDPGNPRRRACDEAEHVTGIILERTLKRWDRGYLLSVRTASEEKFNHSNLGCGIGLSDAEKEKFPIPTKSGTIYLELTVCAR